MAEPGRCSRAFFRAPWVGAVLVAFSVVNTIVTTGYAGAMVSSIQRETGLNGAKWGIVAMMYDVWCIVMTVVLSSPGKKTHRPRLMGACMFVFAVGTVLFASPHWYIMGSGADSAATIGANDLCQAEDTIGSAAGICAGGTSGSREAIVMTMFIISQLFIATGSQGLFIHGPVYMDENISARNMNVYLAAFYAAAALGPAVGYLLGGELLKIWVDPTQGPPQGMLPDSSMWMGAWWLGYLVAAVLALIVLVPMCIFPRRLPGTEDIRREKEAAIEGKSVAGGDCAAKVSEDYQDLAEPETPVEHVSSALTHWIESIWACAEPVKVFNYIGGASEAFAVASLSVFMPQIIESEFGMTPSETSFTFGLIVVLGGALGMVLSGLLIRWRDYDGVQTARFTFLMACLALPFTLTFLLKCDTPDVVGLVRSGNGEGGGLIPAALEVPCNSECMCVDSDANLVCINDQTFLSLCHAGCSPGAGANVTVESPWPLDLADLRCDCSPGETIDITQGYCKDKCSKAIYFFVSLFGLMFFTFANNVPAMQVVLRSTNLKHRSMAVALQSVTFKLLGSIPAPLIFGYFLDKRCLLFSSTCGEQGACALLDNAGISSMTTLMTLGCKSISALSFLASWLLYRRKVARCDEQGMEMGVIGSGGKVGAGAPVESSSTENDK